MFNVQSSLAVTLHRSGQARPISHRLDSYTPDSLVHLLLQRSTNLHLTSSSILSSVIAGSPHRNLAPHTDRRPLTTTRNSMCATDMFRCNVAPIRCFDTSRNKEVCCDVEVV